MRIIAGAYRGTKLVAPKGESTRPTSDKAKEIIFNILSHRWHKLLHHAIVLDAYAGTGALGLEALSRGASYAYFVDTSTEALSCIEYNRLRCRVSDKSLLLKTDATIMTLPQKATLVFIDPPYSLNPLPILTKANHNWKSDALIVLEMSASCPWACPMPYTEVDTRYAGKTVVRFLHQIANDSIKKLV